MLQEEIRLLGQKVYKVFLIGDEGAGKTSIIARLVHDSFNKKYWPSTGYFFSLKSVMIGGEPARIKLLDTVASQMTTLRHFLTFHNHLCCIVVDVSQFDFERVLRWVDVVRGSENPDLPVVVVGNKTDKGRSCSEEMVHKFMKCEKLSYI